jgi:hypothetical protein
MEKRCRGSNWHGASLGSKDMINRVTDKILTRRAHKSRKLGKLNAAAASSASQISAKYPILSVTVRKVTKQPPSSSKITTLTR